MLTTLVLLTGLLSAPAEAEDLSLTDVRLTHGIFGPPRASAKVLPGDRLVVSFDIAGITADEMPGGHLLALSQPKELANRLERYRKELG